MTSPTRRVLDLLSREELAELVRRHDILVGGRARAHLADRLEQKGPPLPALLDGLERGRLDELRRLLERKEGGEAIAALLAPAGAPAKAAPPARRQSGPPTLENTRPDLARQWHPSRNGELRPSDVRPDSPAVVWWMCDGARPHVWQASVSARATMDAGCPSCPKGPAKPLRDHFPELARQFHPTRNLPVRIGEVGVASEKRYWWRCPDDPTHEWQARAPDRIRTPSCPLCTGRLLTPATSLAAKFPAIAAEWHPTRNGALRPDRVRITLNEQVWWRCSYNPAHEWKTTVGLRTRKGAGCPVCRGSKLSPEVAFAVTHPEVAAEWHPTRNGELRPDQMRAGSEKRAWWLCARDPTHEWCASIVNRARGGQGCPMCSGRVATPTTSLRAVRPDVAARWHPTKNGALTPDHIKLHAKRKVWWLCPEDARHVWQAEPSALGRCPFCVGKKVNASNSLAGSAKEVAAEWHPTLNGRLRPERLYRHSLVRVHWQCSTDPTHVWEATIASRIKNGTGCPYCSGRAAGPTSSLAAVHPAIAAEWHPDRNGALRPEDVVPGAAARVWWRCPEGHEWQARVYDRAHYGHGCGTCAREKARVRMAALNRSRRKHPIAAPRPR